MPLTFNCPASAYALSRYIRRLSDKVLEQSELCIVFGGGVGSCEVSADTFCNGSAERVGKWLQNGNRGVENLRRTREEACAQSL